MIVTEGFFRVHGSHRSLHHPLSRELRSRFGVVSSVAWLEVSVGSKHCLTFEKLDEFIERRMLHVVSKFVFLSKIAPFDLKPKG